MAKNVKILIKRDTAENYSDNNFIPRPFELVAAYVEDSDIIVYKLGDGKTCWADLPEITKLSELDRFAVFAPGVRVECFLSPVLIKEFIQPDKAEEG